ncbi:ATP-dependent DNA helicase PIF4-like [Chenopodium quinoa]|uniref:ATP-dependent DNA helicase PIF4-like n=1 Tax=Chenopodium quinoa TaxID=63459 RepID=UPI000B774752|nr:ATP-dependent DNA helicase PIF4-like [Chenopodium quinoa]
MGKSLSACGLAVLMEDTDNQIDRTKDIQDALDAPIPQNCIESRGLLNTAQKEIFTCIMQHIVEGKLGEFFVDGPGGTGKTFLYNSLYAEIRLMNKIVLPTATSGIAAANIPSGRTAHSRFKIPLDSDASLACSVSKKSSLAALIKETTLIIWDEAFMANKQNLESLDLLLQDICDSDVIFGGKVIVFGGDFRQVLPVVPNKTIREAVEASIVSSYIWQHLRRFRLTENLRARKILHFLTFYLHWETVNCRPWKVILLSCHLR